MAYLLKASDGEFVVWRELAASEGVSLAVWIRQSLNALAEGDQGGVADSVVEEVSDERAAEVRPASPSARAFTPDVKPTVAKPKRQKAVKVEPPRPSPCPRWPFHRAGTACSKDCGWEG